MSNYKHGMRHTKLFGVWSSMVARCNNPNTAAYPDYGGRGITVDPDWRDFRNFVADMGVPAAGQTLERIDNSQGYSKTNCRWASRSEQGRNKRNNRLLTVDGVTKTMAEWSEISGIKIATIWARVNKGWDEKTAVTLPLVTKRAGIPAKSKLYLHQPAFGTQHCVDFDK